MTATESTTPSIAQLSDPRHVGGPAANEEYGKCEPMKHGYFSDALCLSESVKKGQPKGKYEWRPAPVGCFGLKHGLYADSGCTTRSEKKGKPKGNYEMGQSAFTGSVGPATLLVEGRPVLECGASSSSGSCAVPTRRCSRSPSPPVKANRLVREQRPAGGHDRERPA